MQSRWTTEKLGSYNFPISCRKFTEALQSVLRLRGTLNKVIISMSFFNSFFLLQSCGIFMTNMTWFGSPSLWLRMEIWSRGFVYAMTTKQQVLRYSVHENSQRLWLVVTKFSRMNAISVLTLGMMPLKQTSVFGLLYPLPWHTLFIK